MSSIMRRVGGALSAVAIFGAATWAPAAADSIYLKNGRVIRTDEARVEGDRVVFRQYGSTQTIPVEIVDRVVEDDRTGPGSPRADDPGRGPVARMPTAGAGNRATGPSVGLGAAAMPPVSGGNLDALLAVAAAANQLGFLADLQSGKPVDTGQVLGALQALGSDGLLPVLALLSSAGAGSPGSELEALGSLLPLMRSLGEILTAPDPDPEATSAAVEELLQGLMEHGVTPEMIREHAQRLGISLEGIRLPGRSR